MSDYVLELKLELQLKEQELAKLLTKVEEKDLEISNLQNALKQKVTVQAIAGSNPDGQKEAKLKINELVREIDRCIALLNK